MYFFSRKRRKSITPDWFKDAVIYQIYPQSFQDSDGDGVGDLAGVISRLDYISSLGVDAIWFNPCFTSPFVDAGYDVADYLSIAPRYGTNADLQRLIQLAGERGIRVLLDLVAGHTSVEHAWFQEELHASGPSPLGDRYVWVDELPKAWDSDLPGTPAWVRSPGPRPGFYLKNFFDEQPALNFGWVDPEEPWQNSLSDAGPRRNVQALKDIIAFWLDLGVAGFRIDMAFSLVKGYDRAVAEQQAAGVWQEIRAWLDVAYPGTVLIPEGSEPRIGGQLAFSADMFLVIFEQHSSLFNNGAAGVLPFHKPAPAFFDEAGLGSFSTFLAGWDSVRSVDPTRSIVMGTADHDFNRLVCGSRDASQVGTALVFLMTWGTIPAIWYGDEIGMRYLPDMPNKEGAICNPGYNRAGCRTPMQWNSSENAGFSTAAAAGLYLPIDNRDDRPTVAAQEADENSVLNLVRRLTALRRSVPALRTSESVEVLHAGYPLVYLRGSTHLVVVNPRREPGTFAADLVAGARSLLSSGVEVSGSVVSAAGFGYGIFELA